MGTKEQILAELRKPPEERSFQTQKEMATFYNVKEEQISQWKAKDKPKKPKDTGDFDLKTYLNQNLKDIAESLVDIIKTKKNTKSIELALKALGELVDKREETHKFELSTDDRIGIATQLWNNLRREYEDTGTCSVCGQCKLLRNPVLLGAESELQEN